MFRLSSLFSLSLLPINVFLFLFFLLPLFFLFFEVLYDNGIFTLANFSRALWDPKITRVYYISFKLAFYISTLQVIATTIMAYALRKQAKVHRLISTILASPTTMSSVVLAQSIITFFGPGGLLPLILRNIGINPPQFIFNELGVIIFNGTAGFPTAFLLILSGFISIDPSIEEAARTLGARSHHIFIKIILPLTLPIILMTYTLLLMGGIAIFIGPMTVGDPLKSTRTIGVEIVRQAYYYGNWDLAYALGAILAIIQFVGFILLISIQRRVIRGG